MLRNRKTEKNVLIVAIVLLSLVAIILTHIYFLYPKEEPAREMEQPPKRVYGERLEEAAAREEQMSDSKTEERTVLARKIFSDEEGTCVADECQYDRFGDPIQRTWYDADGEIRYWGECYYNTLGNLRSVNWYNKNGRCSEGYSFEYDESGNQILEQYFIDGNDLYSWREREFDAFGNLTKELYYDMRIQFMGWHEYEYDTCQRLTQEIIFDEEGVIECRHEYEYDDSCNRVKDTVYDADGSVCEMIICAYEYDTFGNVRKAITYGGDESIRTWYEYEYDESGNLIREMSCHPDGSIDYLYDYEYMTIIVLSRP